MLSLEEAIKHCEEVAEKYCEKVEEGLTADDFCDSCASEHRQLAKWLKELKARRRIDKLDHIILKTAQYQMPEDLEQMRNEIKELEKFVEEANADV